MVQARQAFQEYLDRHWVRALVSLIILSFFLVHASKWYEWGLINRFESIAYDIRLLLTMPETRDDRIVIVEIDEKSLAEEGRWPWSRISKSYKVEPRRQRQLRIRKAMT